MRFPHRWPGPSPRVLGVLVCIASVSGCVSSSRHQRLKASYNELQARNASANKEHRQALMAAQKATRAAQSELASQREQRKACASQRSEDAAKLQVARRAQEQQRSELAQILQDRSKLRAKADEIRDAMQQQAELKKAGEQRRHDRAKLQSGLAGMIAGGHLEIQSRGDSTAVLLPMDPMFSLGAAQLNSMGMTQVQTIGRELSRTFANRAVAMQVRGHTDNVPKRTATIRNNWDLSAARALAVAERLVESGVAPQDLSAAGFGAASPRADNATREGRARNRRIEIVIAPREPRVVPDLR